MFSFQSSGMKNRQVESVASAWGRNLVTMLLSVLFLTSLVGSANALQILGGMEGLSESEEAMLRRATTGDEYLLGVGKADITGYATV